MLFLLYYSCGTFFYQLATVITGTIDRKTQIFTTNTPAFAQIVWKFTSVEGYILWRCWRNYSVWRIWRNSDWAQIGSGAAPVLQPELGSERWLALVSTDPGEAWPVFVIIIDNIATINVTTLPLWSPTTKIHQYFNEKKAFIHPCGETSRHPHQQWVVGPTLHSTFSNIDFALHIATHTAPTYQHSVQTVSTLPRLWNN